MADRASDERVNGETAEIAEKRLISACSAVSALGAR
jgi:hypothetical protein